MTRLPFVFFTCCLVWSLYSYLRVPVLNKVSRQIVWNLVRIPNGQHHFIKVRISTSIWYAVLCLSERPSSTIWRRRPASTPTPWRLTRGTRGPTPRYSHPGPRSTLRYQYPSISEFLFCLKPVRIRIIINRIRALEVAYSDPVPT